MAHKYEYDVVKREVTMPMVLGFFGIELQERGKTLRGQCPFQDGSGHGKDAFIAFPNGWQCHSCGKKGNVLRFVAEKLGLASDWEAAKWCYETFGLDGSVADKPSTTPRPEPKAQAESDHVNRPVEMVDKATEAEEVNKPLAFTLRGIDATHAFLETRGFKPVHAEYLGAGYFPGKGSMAGRFVFPIHNEKDELVAYAGRAVEGGLEPRWKLPEGFKKGLVLYNLNRMMRGDFDQIVVVESFWGVLACVRAGILNSVAIMGRTISEAQLELLSGFREITLVMDGDEPGREASRENASKLLSLELRMLKVVYLPDGEQPDTIPAEELARVIS